MIPLNPNYKGFWIGFVSLLVLIVHYEKAAQRPKKISHDLTSSKHNLTSLKSSNGTNQTNILSQKKEQLHNISGIVANTT